MERVDVPEVARQKGGLGRAEIVGHDVAHDPSLAHEVAADRLAGLDETNVVGWEKAELRNEEDARVEIRRAERTCQGALLLVPGFLEDAFAQADRVRLPILGAVGDAEATRDPAEPVAGRPAQGRRIGVSTRASPIFPKPGVGLERQRQRALAQSFQQAVEQLVAHDRQALVDEHLRRREHDAAVDVVLGLQRGLVAHPDRAMPEESLQVRSDALLQRRERHDAVHRLYFTRIGGDRHDVVDVGFHDLSRAEPVQRVDDEIGVPQPAEPVIPVARRHRRFGYRSRVGGDNRAGLDEAGQLQGDRGANDRRLPFERGREVARPIEPVLPRPLEEVPAGGVDAGQEWFVLAEDQRQRARQGKGDLVDDVGQWRIGRQPHHLFAADVADVIGADDHVGRGTAVSMGRANPNGEARQTGDRLDAPDDLRRPIASLEPIEARREIGHVQPRPFLVGEDGFDDRRVARIARLGLDEPGERDVAEPFFLVPSQQTRKNGIGIEVGKAPPDDPGVAVDQSRGAAVADQCKIEVLLARLPLRHRHSTLLSANSASHARTSLGRANMARAPGRSRPTE